MSIQQNTLLKFLPGPGPSKCPWAWAWVAVKIISVLYHDFALHIKIHLLEMYVSFLQTDGSWLTLDSLLNINYAKNIHSGSHETPKQETSSGFANIAQPLHVPGLPVHALGGHKVRRTFALQNAWRAGATWNTEMLRKYKLILNEHMTNSVVKHTHLWHAASFRPCVAGDNHKNIQPIFLMLSPKTMALERVSGVNTENPMHEYQIKSANSIRFLLNLCSHLLASGLRQKHI